MGPRKLGAALCAGGKRMDLKQYHYVYNAAAHFAAAEKYPDGLMLELQKPGSASFDALCWTLAETATQGELIRRAEGYDRGKIPEEEDFRLRLRPNQIREASEIALRAIVQGLRGDEGPEDTEIDEVLDEIEKKRDAD